MNLPLPIRRVLLFGVPIAALVVVVVTSIVLAEQLPAEVPSSWQGRTTTETMGLVPYTALMAVLVVVLGIGMHALRHGVGEPVSQRVLGGVAAGVPAGLAALHVGVLLSSRGQEPPFTAPVATFVLAAAIAVAVGLLAAAAVQPVERHGAPIEAVRLEIEPGEAVVWTGSSSAPRWSWALVVAAGLAALGTALVGLPWVALVVVALALAASTLLHVAVVVGPGGCTARLGPLRLVRFHVELGAIAAVHAELVEPLVHGGWGLRWLPGVRGIILRRGPGLRVEQVDGPDLVVTVDGAAEAAGVLHAHLRAVGQEGPVARG